MASSPRGYFAVGSNNVAHVCTDTSGIVAVNATSGVQQWVDFLPTAPAFVSIAFNSLATMLYNGSLTVLN